MGIIPNFSQEVLARAQKLSLLSDTTLYIVQSLRAEESFTPTQRAHPSHIVLHRNITATMNATYLHGELYYYDIKNRSTQHDYLQWLFSLSISLLAVTLEPTKSLSTPFSSRINRMAIGLPYFLSFLDPPAAIALSEDEAFHLEPENRGNEFQKFITSILDMMIRRHTYYICIYLTI